MATHDYDIANQSGAAFRTDLNNALAAIQSNNSNSSSPATTVAYQWWADTSAGTLKIRNAANNAWIELFQLDGTLTLEDGTVSAPALAARNDLNTGIFFSEADKFNIATGGVERLELGAETVFNEDGANVDFRIEGDSQTNLFHVDAGSDAIGIRTGSPDRLLTINASATTRMNLKTGSSSTAGIEFGDSDDFNAGFIVYDNSNNSFQIGVNGAGEKVRVLSNGDIGIGTSTVNRSDGGRPTIQFDYSGSDASEGCEIRLSNSAINGNASTDNAAISYIGQDFNLVNRESGTIRFFTSSAVRMTLNSAGNLGIGLTSDPQTSTTEQGVFLAGVDATQSTISSSTTPLVINRVGTGGNDRNCLELRNNGTLRGTIGALGAQNGVFLQTDGSERVRIHSSGEVSIATTSKNLQGGGASDFYVNITANTGTNHNGIVMNGIASAHSAFNTKPSADHQYFAAFYLNSSGSGVGSISVGSSSTTFNTSSDYRLKENVVNLSDGITRLKQLLPKRFNWISDETNTLQDGFLAHEVSSLVPEAVTGEKDAVATENGGQYAKGDPIYQTIDHSKLVPLLVAAVKELITKVEALEAA